MSFASSVSKPLAKIPGSGPATVRVAGQITHFISQVRPEPDKPHKFCQLYFLNAEDALEARKENVAQTRITHKNLTPLRTGLLKVLDEEIRSVNVLAAQFKTLADCEKEEMALAEKEDRPVEHYDLMIHTDARNDDQRRYNQPTKNDVACVFRSPDGAPPTDREFVAKLIIPRDGKPFARIGYLQPMCDPLCYVILFPSGDPGWSADMMQVSLEELLTPLEPHIQQEEDDYRDFYGPAPGGSANDQEDLGFGLEGEHGEEQVDVIGEPNVVDDEDFPIHVVRTIGSRRNPGREKQRDRRRVTMSMFYSSRFSIRKNVFNPVLWGGKLMCQYAIDSFLKIEGNNLKFYRENQEKMHAGKYILVRDVVNKRAENENLNVGSIMILPSTFIGGIRYMKQAYQDAMAIVGKYGKPDLFITFTCNPKWKEVTDCLLPLQFATDRPDLIARVFQNKLKQMCNDIQKGEVFGKVVARIHVIEFQKRGLPHAHMLLILDEKDKPKTIEYINLIVSAEMPDREKNPALYEIITNSMIHGPCGIMNPNSSCMEGGKCSKDYPKEFIEETIAVVGGYPQYRRRDDKKTYQIKKANNQTMTVDNRWVVPYNPYLCSKYEAHINFEIVASLEAVKYLFAYCYKGHDCANIQVTAGTSSADGKGQVHWDEIQSYMDSRYVASAEAMWRIFKYPLSYRSHAVIRLAVHLDKEQVVTFKPGQEDQALERAEGRDTELTAWFKLNQKDEFASTLHYRQIPEHYVWNSKDTKWTRRKRAEDVIGRVYTVSIGEPERYCLRLLLLSVKGATSFENLREVNGIQHSTFQDAAIALNLLKDDTNLETTLKEAIAYQMPSQLRDLFAMLCVYGVPRNAKRIFDENIIHLSEDFLRRHPPAIATNLALFGINRALGARGKNNKDYGLPEPIKSLISAYTKEAFPDDIELTKEQYKALAEADESVLNTEQEAAYQTILEAVGNENIEKRQFFLDGPGGTGKTFVYKLIARKMMSMGHKVISVASTGIAATLLINGRTYHSQFKLFPPITETTASKIELSSPQAREIENAKLIIWDEATMTPAHALNALDTLLKEIMKRPDLPFGGKPVLLGGDFRQCLPIVVHGHRVAIVESSIKSSPTWDSITTLKLTKNMRTATDSQEYSDWLAKLGDGELTIENIPTGLNLGEDMIEIPQDFILPDGTDVVTHVYGEDGEMFKPENESQLYERAILCPKNEDCREINYKVVNTLIPGEMHTYKSMDSIDSQDPVEVSNFPTEFLNTLEISGLPQHCLRLKKGAIIMVLQNLDTKNGLCNGTRLFVRDLTQNLIKAEHASGKNKGKIVFIPRITISPSDADIPFTLKRYQFPVVLAFAMTINKSQGQTFSTIGIHLSSPVFAHGQLYVAFSRATTRAGVKIAIVNDEGPVPTQGRLIRHSTRVFTKNIVYREIFRRQPQGG